MSKATQIRKVLEHDRADEAVTIRFHEIIEELNEASRTAHRMLANCPSQYAIKAELGVV